jgi:penicillin amidase
MGYETTELSRQINSTSLTLSSLNGTVIIRRDQRGIPYIEAEHEADIFFAQGYATAGDRLWQMDFLRRMARGELAEIMGPSALELDKLHRLYGFARIAEKLYEGASSQTQAILESYARGINSYVENCAPAELPLEFKLLSYLPREWTPSDSLALGKLFAEQLSVSVDVDIMRALLGDLAPAKRAALLPRTSPLDVLVVGSDLQPEEPLTTLNQSAPETKPDAFHAAVLTQVLKAMRRSRAAGNSDREVGSNSWVAAGKLTESGKPMLASDPHLAPTSPSIWHIVHLSAPGLKVAGVSVPGMPGVMIGHNERIAWGITNLCPDVQDLYFEEFNESDPTQYKTPMGWQDAEVRREEIKVRQPADAPAGALTLDVKITRHGPIIFEKDRLGLAVRWTAFDAEVVDLDAFIALNRAANWDDFVAALRNYGGPPQNFTYADVEGHIGYYSAGLIPVRNTGDGSLPYNGATDEGEWNSFIPFAELPHVYDPPEGIIVMANQRLVGHDYPHHLTHNWRVPYRARRIFELLKAKTKHSVEDFLSIQGDTYSYPDALFAAEIVKLATPLVSSSSEWSEMSEKFAGWDGFVNAESNVLPLLVEMRKGFFSKVLANILGGELAQLYEWRNEATFLDKLITERAVSWLPAEFDSYESLLLVCYREAKHRLAERFGPDAQQWTWGRLAPVRFPHPLERIESVGARFAVAGFPQNTGGSMPTVNAGERVSMRFVADLNDWDSTRFCLPLGESGNPASPHHHDQLDEWRNVSPSVLPFSDEAILKATRNTLTMTKAISRY